MQRPQLGEHGMGGDANSDQGPDFGRGVDVSAVADGAMLRGHVGGESALLIRRGDEFHFIGAECTHYHAPLSDGLVVGDTLRCPWHHARFDLSTGRALCAPAFDALPLWRAERVGERVYARDKLGPAARPKPGAAAPKAIVIVGAGAAGFAAAHTLREEGYDGAITLIGADPAPPYDRPNLSKDYLAGLAPEDWLPLRGDDWYREQRIDLRLGCAVKKIRVNEREVELEDGSTPAFERLLLATGAEPVRLPTPGMDQPHVHYLRTLKDSRAIVAAAEKAERAIVIGASFIGLEVAASLRQRKIETHVVAPESAPMERVLGPDLAKFIRALHEERGVVFHLGRTVAAIDAKGATLDDGARVDCDLVVVGVGVRPALSLAQECGLALDNGVLVDERLETSAPGIFAAGDIARWPDKISGERIRVEHWALAERQGQTAARNMLGANERFEAAPFFWSAHYGVVISYVGHAQIFDRTELAGDLAAHDASVAFYRGERRLAVATLFRDIDSLRAEAAFEEAIRKN
ncbi:MAG TPA: FAD-dependent oxidoreductase [Methylocystis sp.]|nr:FAD-dependent oxidoreductase [Methylocystis sp.]